jgi:hypothetical protein
MNLWVVKKRDRPRARVVPRLIIKQREERCCAAFEEFDLVTRWLPKFRLFWAKVDKVVWSTGGHHATILQLIPEPVFADDICTKG